MKKFISMFAFAAAIVLGAFALASCGNDDDEEENVKHTFAYSAMLNSDNPATTSNPAFIQKQQTLRILSEIGLEKFTATDKEAKATWDAVKAQYEDKMLDEVLKLCEEFDDYKIYLQIGMTRDGMPWQALVCRSRK